MKKRKSSIPNRKALRGERTLNDAIHNAARHLRWLVPRMRKRGYIVAYVVGVADFLDVTAQDHERKVARRAA